MRSTTSSLRVSNPQLGSSASVAPVSAVHAVVLDWHRSAEGQGVLAHLVDPETGARKVYGTLERPVLPPTVQVVRYKVYLSGRYAKCNLQHAIYSEKDMHKFFPSYAAS